MNMFSVIDDGNILNWAICNGNCPKEEIPLVCMEPPPTPSFINSMPNHLESTLFMSSWFDSEISENGSMYKLSAIRKRRHQPEWKYDPGNLTDLVTIYVKNNLADLHTLYSIFPENQTVHYNCPKGFKYDHSEMVSMSLTCKNGTWISETFFNASKFCTRKCFPRSLFKNHVL